MPCFPLVTLWSLIKSWIGIRSIQPIDWTVNLSINDWWSMMACNAYLNRKAIVFLTMLVSWIIWKGRNTRVFHNKAAPPTVLLDLIKQEARLWAIAGAKILDFVLTGE
jgi:hypothetical protein